MTTIESASYPTVDRALAQRLERAEAMAGAAHVEVHGSLHPTIGAEWIEVAGAYAMFDGIDSPITQTFGLGVFDPVDDTVLDRIEAFFTERGAPTAHEVCTLASPDVWRLLSARGYSPIEASTVLVRPTAVASDVPASDVTTRIASLDETAEWSRIAGQGWGSESAELAAMVEALGPVMLRTRGSHCFFAELHGEPIGVGVLNVTNGIALFGGACTIASARRRGAQAKLLATRLEFARSLGLDLAMIVAQPGSASQRNAERRGFRPVYTRAKWRRALPDGASSAGEQPLIGRPIDG